MRIAADEAGAGSAGLAVSASFKGSVPPLLEALHRLPLSDLVLEEPDLEEAALSLYGEEDNSATGTEGR
ncbi:hypothetical protein ODZ83_08005 [Acaricomes phytoseiuli]|uniref:hypothetical protein n=1 Tax=Acaricomes phytoseiuli TaxID=291968 RepID=UPI00035C9CFE|nr:hypothetical protein [Acaricomes phytoseiuli]MCW1250123.1 hypothetical protein [Acaricomes phytoseiuli]